MKKYRYTTTDCFKEGDYVWVSGIKFSTSGRTSYCMKPTKVKIISKTSDYIRFDPYELGYSGPNTYYLDSPNNPGYSETSINSNIAKTKEEAIKNFNDRIEEEIEEKYENFRAFERRAKSRLL